jgi:hypothetical protein
VDAGAEGDVPVRSAVDPAGLRRVGVVLVAVRRGEGQADHLAGGHRASPELGVGRCVAGEDADGGGEPQELLHGRRDQRAVRPAAFEIGRVLGELPQGVGQGGGRGLVPGDEHQHGEAADLVLGEPAALDLAAQQEADEVVGLCNKILLS